MTDTKKIILLGTLAAIPVVALAGMSYANYVEKNLDISPAAFDFYRSQDDVLNVSMKFLVKNNTGLSFTIKSTDCNIFLNNNFLGIAQMPREITVADKTTQELLVKASFDSDNLKSYALTFLSGLFTGGGGLKFVVVGKSKIRVNTWLPITVNYPINETFNV